MINNPEYERGWKCEHHEYGTWFISKSSIIEDWKSDYRRYYEKEPEKEPCNATIETWRNEQISWVEIRHYGIQLKRPDLEAHEARWLKSMTYDVDIPDKLTKFKMEKS